MNRNDLLLRGRHRCVGLLLDPATAGVDVTMSRVLSQWSAASTLYELPDDRWLLLFGETIELDGDAAHGALVVEHGSGLSAAPTLTPQSRTLATWVGGVEHAISLDGLNKIEPSTWITFAHPVEVLTMPALPPEPTVSEQPKVSEPDLRSMAKVGKRSDRSTKFADELARQQQAGSRRAKRTGVGSRTSGVAPRSHKRSGSGAFAKLALRTPAKGYVSRRHNKYLQELETKFTSGDFREALRHAIPLGGLGGGSLSLRMPGRRDDLRLSGGASGGSSVPYDITVQAHLNKMYRQAAQELEANGRIDEAAFVLSELLNSAAECVALLERHRRYRTAAELSEARELDAALIVRLWWLAGDKDRAMALARRDAAYAQVVKQLADSDPEVAREFRLLWVDVLEKSGNLHGAIAVGWPDPQIRSLLLNPIRKGIAANDEWSLGLRAYLLALQPSEVNRQYFIDGLSDTNEPDEARRFAAEVLAEVKATDPVVDRQVCSAALRAFVELPAATKRSIDRIRDRSDPVLAADLPSPRRTSHRTGPVAVPSGPPGARAVNDAVPLSNGTVLVSLGEAGVRLLTVDGRAAAEWSTPCHALVASDHDKSALVLTVRDSVVDVHVLDLVTRKMRHYGAIRTDLWATSFDGATWVTRDSNGRLAFCDVLADSATIIWRELDAGTICHRLERSPDFLAAVVAIPPSNVFPEARTQVWSWALPGRRLDDCRNLAPVEDSTSLHLLSDGHVIWGIDDGTAKVFVPSGKTVEVESLAGASELQVCEEFMGYRNEDGVVVIATLGKETVAPVATWSVGGDTDWRFRSQRNLLALWTSEGSITVIDTSRCELVSVTSTLP